jgi:hypothetical protein
MTSFDENDLRSLLNLRKSPRHTDLINESQVTGEQIKMGVTVERRNPNKPMNIHADTNNILDKI